jgi:hypothetical protein
MENMEERIMLSFDVTFRDSFLNVLERFLEPARIADL